jgi:hypothetical protein
MRFEALLARHGRGELNQEEAAEILGFSERTSLARPHTGNAAVLPGLSAQQATLFES